MKLKWTRDGDQHVAQGNGFEYRITEWSGPYGSNWILRIKASGADVATNGGEYPTLKRAKEVAYSLDIR